MYKNIARVKTKKHSRNTHKNKKYNVFCMTDMHFQYFFSQYQFNIILLFSMYASQFFTFVQF